MSLFIYQKKKFTNKIMKVNVKVMINLTLNNRYAKIQLNKRRDNIEKQLQLYALRKEYC